MKNDEYWEGIDMQGKTFIQEKVNKIDSYKTISHIAMMNPEKDCF